MIDRLIQEMDLASRETEKEQQNVQKLQVEAANLQTMIDDQKQEHDEIIEDLDIVSDYLNSCIFVCFFKFVLKSLVGLI